MRYPESPGVKSQLDTTIAAAEAMKPTAGNLRRKVLAALEGHANLTADECAALMKESILAIRPRFSELHAKRFIVDTGERRKNASGKSAVVWRVETSPETPNHENP